MNRTVDQALTVGQLIELLQNEDQDLPVVFSYNYGDHWNTQVLAQVEELEEGTAEWSAYHDMFKLADDNNDSDDEDEIREGDDEPEEEINRVLILR